MRALIRALGLALLLPALTAGQQIRGVVVDDQTGRAISDVKIELLVDGTTVRATTSSAASGWFELSPQSGGQFLLRAFHSAYQSVGTLAVALGPQEILTVVIRLRGGPIPMAPVIVKTAPRDRLTGYRERARRAAFGHFVTRADIDKHGGHTLSDVLRFTPGLRFERVMAGPFNSEGVFMRSFGDLCVPNIYLDGHPVPTDRVFDINDLLSVDRIEGVEVYRSFQSAPLELRSSASDQDMGCGVIAVWSRPVPGGPLTRQRLLLAGVLIGASFVSMRYLR